MPKHPDTLSSRLIAARAVLGLSQHALAEQAGVSRSSIALIEYGRTRNPSITTMLKLAKVLCVSPQDLMPDSHDLAEFLKKES